MMTPSIFGENLFDDFFDDLFDFRPLTIRRCVKSGAEIVWTPCGEYDEDRCAGT